MASSLPGLLLLRADLRAATGWVERGIAPAYVVPLAEWTAVVPAGAAQAKPPYDDALKVLAGRPVPWRARPALGFFVIAGKAVLTVQPRRLRQVTKWLVWQPVRGTSPVPGLPEATIPELVAAAGAAPQAERRLRGALHERTGTVLGLCATAIDALALPGADLLHPGVAADTPRAVLVQPLSNSVARFSRITEDDATERQELEENS